MKCPQCGSSKIAYDTNRSKESKTNKAEAWRHVQKKKIIEARTDFRVTCKACGFKGEIQ